MERTAARSAGAGAPVGASIFPENVKCAVIPPVSLSDIDHHGTDILLQNQSDGINSLGMLFHHQRTGGPDRGMSREVELCPRGEDTHSIGVRGIVLRQDEG